MGTGNALSIKILDTSPLERPTIKDSCFGGPLTTLTNLIWSSRIHSRTRMPVNASS